MINSVDRIGNFTSSEIHRLMSVGTDKVSPGKPFFSYIEEKRMERRLGRSLDKEAWAKPLSWGLLVESRVNNLLGTSYCVSSDETNVNPEIEFHSGSKDGIHHSNPPAIAEIKCPITMKSFCEFADSMGEYEDIKQFRISKDGQYAIDQVRKNHSDGNKYYWQVVSNAVINGLDFGELIFYVPYRTELEEIREEARNYDGPVPTPALFWLNYATDEELPYILPNGHYRNLNIVRFPILESAKDALIQRILLAGKELLK